MPHSMQRLRAPGGKMPGCAPSVRHADSPAAVHRRPRKRRCLAWLMLACGVAGAPVGAISADPAGSAGAATASHQTAGVDEIRVEIVEDGVSTRRIRKTAIDELPLERLSPEARRVAQSVVDQVSLHRRLPVVKCEADPRVMQYFLACPDVAVSIWRALEISQLQLQYESPGRYKTDSGDGTTGTISVLLADPRQQLIFCEGLFKSPVLPRAIKAQAIMHMQAEYPPPGSVSKTITCRADVFVSFPSTTIETAARVASPVSNRIADRNFEEVATFIRMMHVAMTQQPGWVEQIANRLGDVPIDRRELLLEVTARVYVDAQRRLAGPASAESTPEALRLPVQQRGPEVRTPQEGGAAPPVRSAQQPPTGAQR